MWFLDTPVTLRESFDEKRGAPASVTRVATGLTGFGGARRGRDLLGTEDEAGRGNPKALPSSHKLKISEKSIVPMLAVVAPCLPLRLDPGLEAMLLPVLDAAAPLREELREDVRRDSVSGPVSLKVGAEVARAIVGVSGPTPSVQLGSSSNRPPNSGGGGTACAHLIPR